MVSGSCAVLQRIRPPPANSRDRVISCLVTCLYDTAAAVIAQARSQKAVAWSFTGVAYNTLRPTEAACTAFAAARYVLPPRRPAHTTMRLAGLFAIALWCGWSGILWRIFFVVNDVDLVGRSGEDTPA